MDKKFYGLIIPKKLKKLEQKSKSVFESSDEETEDSSHPTRKTDFPSLSSKSLAKNITLQKKLEEDDPTIYEYDSIYDSLKQNQSEKQKSTKKTGPKYITNLLKAADKRKQEQERRQERKIQTEREKEGDEFKDKEAFVTSAYKKKMMEMQEEEDREKLQDQIDEMMDVTKQKDLSGFYRHYLKQTVGEEKIPEFGDRESKIKELSKRIKKENSPIPDEKKRQDDIEKYANLDADSYGSSDSDDESNNDKKYQGKASNVSSHSSSDDDIDKNKSQLKSSTKIANRKTSESKSSDSSEDEVNEKVLKKHPKSVEKKLSADQSLSENSESDTSEKFGNSAKRKLSKSHSQSPKRLKQDVRAASLDDGRDSQNGATINIESDGSHVIDENSNIELNPKQTKSKIDIRLIFVKRTVGELFDQAQKRYFQRMATRKAS